MSEAVGLHSSYTLVGQGQYYMSVEGSYLCDDERGVTASKYEFCSVIQDEVSEDHNVLRIDRQRCRDGEVLNYEPRLRVSTTVESLGRPVAQTRWACQDGGSALWRVVIMTCTVGTFRPWHPLFTDNAVGEVS
jgi:hypothetical protein